LRDLNVGGRELWTLAALLELAERSLPVAAPARSLGAGHLGAADGPESMPGARSAEAAADLGQPQPAAGG